MEHSHHDNHPKPSSEKHSNHQQDGSSTDEHMAHHTADFLKRCWICLILTIPVILLFEMIQHWFGFQLSFEGSKYVLLGFSIIIFVYSARLFLTGMVVSYQPINCKLI